MLTSYSLTPITIRSIDAPPPKKKRWGQKHNYDAYFSFLKTKLKTRQMMAKIMPAVA